MVPKPEDYGVINFARLETNERSRVYSASIISLCQEERGKIGLDYLTQERGLDIGTITKFRLGFVPFDIPHPLRGRIMMPIFDIYGNILSLSFRPIIDSKDIKPKYWNESFLKGDHLYGLQIAKYEICRMGFAILVEGQIDVCMMHSYGFRNTVGIMGSAITPMQILLLMRWTNQVVIIMDGDQAGRMSVERARDVLDYYQYGKHNSSRSLKYGIVDLPFNEDENDPAKFLKVNGSKSMKNKIIDQISINGIKPFLGDFLKC